MSNKSLRKVSPVIRDRARLKTVLPDDLYLNEEEIYQLLQIENKFNTEINSKFFAEVFDVANTSNIGLHYFCIENTFALDQISSNKSLSMEAASFLLKTLEGDAVLSSSVLIYRNLLNNPVVYGNLELFQKVFWKFPKNSRDSIVPAIARAVPDLPINTLMFLLENMIVKNQGFSALVYNFEAALREPEILKWVSIKVPDLKDLPSTWVLRAYGLEKVIGEEDEEDDNDE